MNGSPGRSLETLASLRAAFDEAPAYTIGVEEEVMLLSPADLALAPVAAKVLARLDGDPRFKLELPASQLEIITDPVRDVEAVHAALREGRAELGARCEGVAVPAAAGVHPFSPTTGELNGLPRYEHLRRYGRIAARQLVCALQVHVAAGDSARALSVYNAMRSYLPLLAALAANAPFYDGRDTGFASVRPKLAELLPRQGIPPSFSSWESYAGVMRGDLRTWWWELRLHPSYGTLEVRVPDAQSTVADAAAIAAVVHCLVVWLGGRHDRGEMPVVAPTWHIERNRWAAARHGVQGEMVSWETGERQSTRDLLHALLDDLSSTGDALTAAAWLARARELTEANGAIQQRRAARSGGARAAARWLAERFAA